MSTVLATHDFATGGLEAAQEFLKRTRAELRQLRKVRVWKDKLHVIDVNKDGFEVRGLGYGDPEIVPLLKMINTAFDPGIQGIRHRPSPLLGRRSRDVRDR